MPEGPEVETEKLEEAIKEELDHEGGAFLKQIAITRIDLQIVGIGIPYYKFFDLRSNFGIIYILACCFPFHRCTTVNH